MSDRGSNSGLRSLVKDKDVAPGDSASQAGSSMSRASEKARRAAAEVRAWTARRCATKELEIAALREEIVGIETEGAQKALHQTYTLHMIVYAVLGHIQPVIHSL